MDICTSYEFIKFMSIDSYINGVSVPKCQEKDSSILHQEKRKNNSKNAEEILSTNITEEGFTIVVEDESIFVHDALVRRKMWTAEGMHPVVTMTGRQLFRQYDTFDHNTFLLFEGAAK
jgi:phosphoribosylformimino-5-aminoimidazole carboxamide ribonucleotide (ProFAR) isomerase